MSDELYQLELKRDPLFRQNRMDIAQHLKSFNKHTSFRSNTINIPVVVHIIYHKAEENISDTMVQSQIDILNKDFGEIQSNKYHQAAASKIKFTLATSDPQGYKTNGIVRFYTSIEKFQPGPAIMSSAYGGQNAWPSDAYLNIWVGNLSGVLGYAYMPGQVNDGVVIGYQFFGLNNTYPFNLGRTTTHEVGHWFNLFHIWGLMPGCTEDDEVEDTPNSAGPNYGCLPAHISCMDTDMVENYMDYSDDACMNVFTHDQVTRMEALFSPGGYRESILHSHGLNKGIENLCNNGIQDGDETGIDCGGSCLPCTCIGKGSFSLFDYIQSIKINDSISITGDNSGMFTNYSKRFELYSNKPNLIQCVPGISAYQSKEFWSIWVDLNRDGNYDTGELLYKNNGQSLIKDTIDLKNVVTEKQLQDTNAYHLRIQMQWGKYGNGCDTFEIGEVENYNVVFKKAILDLCSNGIQDESETGVDCGSMCKPCALQYCTSKGKVSKYEFIQSVTLVGWNNTTGNNNGYSDFSSQPIEINASQGLDYNLSAGFGGKYTLSENWYVWADWNQDGDFEDEKELLLDASSTIPLSGAFIIPNAVEGNIRMRIQMRDSKKANPCENFGYGEVEDYRINVTRSSMRQSVQNNIPTSIKIFPNPVHQILFIKSDFSLGENQKIRLINVLGQTVVNQSSHQNEIQINCTTLLNGLYQLEITNGIKKEVHQVIVVH